MLKKIILYHVEIDTAEENMMCELLTPPTIAALREIAAENNAADDILTVLNLAAGTEIIVPEPVEGEDVYAETPILVAGSEIGRISVSAFYVYLDCQAWYSTQKIE
jgi:hypothetical protein